MSEGASLTSFAAEIGVARSTITLWIDTHPEFMASVNVAKAKCAAWWETVNRNIAVNGGGTGSAQACALGLKNMASDDWREKHAVEHTGKDGGAIQIEQATTDADAFTRRIASLAARTSTGSGNGSD